MIPRLDYLNFIQLIKRTEFIATDGGSNQEEAYYLGKPCLILRDRTERIEGLGKNSVLCKGQENIIQYFLKNYKNFKREKIKSSIRPSKIIVNYLMNC